MQRRTFLAMAAAALALPQAGRARVIARDECPPSRRIPLGLRSVVVEETPERYEHLVEGSARKLRKYIVATVQDTAEATKAFTPGAPKVLALRCTVLQLRTVRDFFEDISTQVTAEWSLYYAKSGKTIWSTVVETGFGGLPRDASSRDSAEEILEKCRRAAIDRSLITLFRRLRSVAAEFTSASEMT